MKVPVHVSIIIVNYNSGEVLKQSVAAALRSEIEPELIVCDNASSDSSIDFLRKDYQHDLRVKLIQNTENLGFAGANNIGISKSSADYILLLNPDCIIAENTIAHMLDVLKSDSTAGMAGCLVRNQDGSIQRSCIRKIPNPWQALVRVLHLDKLFPKAKKFQNYNLADKALPTKAAEVEGISGACMLVKREAIDDVGLLDERYFLYCEDDDWFVRFRQKGWKILFVPGVEVTHHKGVCGRSHPIKVLWYKHRSMLRFYRKFYFNQYPKILYPLVCAAVWARFGIMVLCQPFVQLRNKKWRAKVSS